MLKINDLVVADFRSKFYSDEIKEWKEKTNTVDMESCARQVWLGTMDDFKDFPGSNIEGAKSRVLYGVDAYEYMLQLIVGIRSEQIAETNIAGQVFKSFDGFLLGNPNLIKYYSPIFDNLRCDSSLIRGQIVEKMSNSSFEGAARLLSGQSKGSKALYISDGGRNNGISDNFTSLAKLLANNRKGRVGEFSVSSPDNAFLNNISRKLYEMKSIGQIFSDVSSEPFNTLEKSFLKYDQVFVDMHMGTDSDDVILSAWDDCVRDDNTLVHLKGDPACKGMSNEYWSELGIDNIVLPEDIRVKRGEIQAVNKSLMDMALNACKKSAEYRLVDKRFNRRDIKQLSCG